MMKKATELSATFQGFETLEEIVSIHRLRLNGQGQPFIVLPGIYPPDEWSLLTIQAAQTALDLRPDIDLVLELGCGSGVIPLILARINPNRDLRFVCCDIKSVSSRNLDLNFQLFGDMAKQPRFHCLDISGKGTREVMDGAPALVIANVPQLPVSVAVSDADPDDYHPVTAEDREDPVRAFGLGLLLDIGRQMAAANPAGPCLAFCRSSRIPHSIFDAFLDRIGGKVCHQGPGISVRDGSTPFDLLAEAEERFGVSGTYEWAGRTVSATELRGRRPAETEVFIGLQSCLIQLG